MILFVSLVTMPLWENNVAQENVSLTDQNTTDYTNPPINRVERLSRRFQHPKREMDFTEKWDILSERMEHHKRERTGAQKQSFSDDIEPEWVTHYASGLSPAIDVATDIAVDNLGNVYVTGYSQGSGGDQDYATVKYNSEGQEQWVARYNGPGNVNDWAEAIAVDGSGNVYVTGRSYGSGTEDDYATLKYNSEGEEEWVARYNGPGNSSDCVNAIAVDGSGNVYVTGYSEVDNWSVYTTIKYSGDIGIEDEDTNLPETLYLGNNYPNPFNSSTTIQYTLPRREYVRLAIYNISGQLVNTVENGVRSVGVHTAIWDGTDEQGRSVTNGIYFYKLEAGGKTFVKKMILMR